jgi:hypothetical protein
VKRLREEGAGPTDTARDEFAGAPLSRERIGAGSGRSRLLGPAILGTCVAIAIIALSGRFLTSVSAPATPTPAPTPVAWLGNLVTPDANATPNAAPPLRVMATGPNTGPIFVRGQENHFTLNLRNASGGPISLDPCPAYRMYLQGSDSSTAPWHALNCAAMGTVLDVGQAIDLDMVFTPAMTDPIGGQSVVWEWTWPDTVQALAIIRIYVEG